MKRRKFLKVATGAITAAITGLVAIGTHAQAKAPLPKEGVWTPADLPHTITVYCSGTLSESDIQTADGWVAHNNGQTALLPDGHPYKSIPPDHLPFFLTEWKDISRG